MRYSDAVRYKVVITRNKSETEFWLHQEIHVLLCWFRKKIIMQDHIYKAGWYCTYITLFVINSHSVGDVGSVLCLDSVPLVTCYCERESHFLLFFLGELLRWVRSGTSVHTVRFYVSSTEGSPILVSLEACAGIFLFILLFSASMHTKGTSQQSATKTGRDLPKQATPEIAPIYSLF